MLEILTKFIVRDLNKKKEVFNNWETPYIERNIFKKKNKPSNVKPLEILYPNF
jgi:hypothetical protein